MVGAVADQEMLNRDIYSKWIRTAVGRVLDGYNVSVLCYGVTGSGKTHTMFGDKLDDMGLVYLSTEHLLQRKEQY